MSVLLPLSKTGLIVIPTFYFLPKFLHKNQLFWSRKKENSDSKAEQVLSGFLHKKISPVFDNTLI